MSAQTTISSYSSHRPAALIEPDRRRHKRHALSLLGRYMRADRHEYVCQTLNVSVGGMALLSPVQPGIGESLIVYIDELGGLEGDVVRHFEGGFAIELRATQHKREKLAARITWLVNRSEFAGAEMREYERVLPHNDISTLKISDDITTQVQVLDVSLSGANVATEARPPIGSEVVLGKLRAMVMRHHDRGIGVRFVDIQDPDALRRTFG
ncbi:MAG: PilZ domain-containing protein [Hyphomicrobiaceae bacterium]|nr:PilZ domain-containing protein [Hyphomicrobiaceae bacterium]